MADAQDWLEQAKDAILALLDTEQTLVHPEIEGRLSEGGYDGSTTIDPHHITTALRELGREERIVFQRGTTRGGSTIQTIQPADQHRRATPIAEASARKRLLLARHNSWAQGNKRHPERLIGPAGEESVRKAILGSGTVIPATPGAAAVSNILNVSVAGPLDSAGYLQPSGQL